MKNKQSKEIKKIEKAVNDYIIKHEEILMIDNECMLGEIKKLDK